MHRTGVQDLAPSPTGATWLGLPTSRHGELALPVLSLVSKGPAGLVPWGPRELSGWENLPPTPGYPTPLLSVRDRDWQGWRASSVGFLPCPRPAGCCQQSGCAAAAREDTETAGQRRLAARERPWPQVCLVLPARGVQRILKYVSVFFKSRDSTHVRTHTHVCMYVYVCIYGVPSATSGDVTIFGLSS